MVCMKNDPKLHWCQNYDITGTGTAGAAASAHKVMRHGGSIEGTGIERCIENTTGVGGNPISNTDPRIVGFLEAGGCLRQLQVGCSATHWMGTHRFRRALRVALKLLGALGIPTLPVWGSALAVARGIQKNPVSMPWDDDIDVAIDEEGVQQLLGPGGPKSRGDNSTETCGPLEVACDITNTPSGKAMLQAWAREQSAWSVKHVKGTVYRVSLRLLLGPPTLDAADGNRRGAGTGDDYACVGFGDFSRFGVGAWSGPNQGNHLKAWYSAGCGLAPTDGSYSSLFDLFGGVCSGRAARLAGSTPISSKKKSKKPGGTRAQQEGARVPCTGTGWDRLSDESKFAHFHRYVKAGMASTSVQSFGGGSVAAAPRKETNRFVAGVYGADWNASVIICPHSQFGYFPDCKKAGNPPLPLEAVRAAMAAIPECTPTY